MSGVLDRQEVIAVLDEHEVGARGHRPECVPSYRETLADALMALAERYVVPADNRSFYRVALLEAAAEQRRLAADARTDNGQAEHTDIADWLEERASQLAATPAPVVTDDAAQIVAAFIAQREEYVRVLRQCVDADADYHRWQGHAEARRQLADRLRAAPLLGPRPLLDRDAVRLRLETARGHRWDDDTTADGIVELARTMPTDAEIHEAIDSALDSHAYDDVPIAKITVALRALLNGAES